MPDLSAYELDRRKAVLAGIIAKFLKCEPGQVTVSTRIDRTSISSSIQLHKMYSLFKKEGIDIRSSRISTFGDLVSFLNKNSESGTDKNENDPEEPGESGSGIGIDIEDVKNLPETNDYRSDDFYAGNFSQKEIAHSILQADPRISFAGQFALKEAIVKADNRYRNVPFSRIEIYYDSRGKPVFDGFEISISHTRDLAAAVAVRLKNRSEQDNAGCVGTNTTEYKVNRVLFRYKWYFYLLFTLNIVVLAVVLITKFL